MSQKCLVCNSDLVDVPVEDERITFSCLFSLMKCSNPELCLSMSGFVAETTNGITVYLRGGSRIAKKYFLNSAHYISCKICDETTDSIFAYDYSSEFVREHILHTYSHIIVNWKEYGRAGVIFTGSDRSLNSMCNVLYSNMLNFSDVRKKPSIMSRKREVNGLMGLVYGANYGARLYYTLGVLRPWVVFDNGGFMLTYKKKLRSESLCVFCHLEYDSEYDFPTADAIKCHAFKCLSANKKTIMEDQTVFINDRDQTA